MAEDTSGSQRRFASIDVALERGPILVCSARGYITQDVQRAAFVRIDQALAEAAGLRVRLLWDSTGIDGFEPGLPMALTRFLLARIVRFDRAALVARHPMVVAVGRAAMRMIPPFPYTVCADRDEAMTFLNAHERAA